VCPVVGDAGPFGPEESGRREDGESGPRDSLELLLPIVAADPKSATGRSAGHRRFGRSNRIVKGSGC